MNSLRLTKDQIEHAFGTETFRRGEEYFHNGRVLEAIKFRAIVYGEVLGTSRYKTKVDLVNGVSSECSCPVGYDCKHGVALALYYLKGHCADGDKALQEINAAGKFELLKALEKLIEDDPMLLPKVANALRIEQEGEGKRQHDPKLIALVEKRVKSMLRMLERGEEYAGGFVQSFADLVKSNQNYMSKDLIFFALEFLVKNSEDYGYFYDDYSDSTFGEAVFESLCDALVRKPINEGDFRRLVDLKKNDEYDMLETFMARIAIPENAKALSKLPSAQKGVKELLAEYDEALYVEFLINSGGIDEARIIIRDTKIAGLNEEERFDLYLKIDEKEALEFARERRYYHCLADHYHGKGDYKEVVDIFRTVIQNRGGTPQRWLNDGCGLSILLRKIFDSLRRNRPSDYGDLARGLFRVSYRLSEYALCVEVGIALNEPKLLYTVLEGKNSHLLDPESRIKLLEHLSKSDPERAVKELKSLTDKLIEEKKDYSYDQAVKCTLIVKRLIKEDEWRTYLRSLSEAHYRKINLWKSLKRKGIPQPDR